MNKDFGRFLKEAKGPNRLRQFLSYVADPPRGFASLEKVMKRQWGSRRDTRQLSQTKSRSMFKCWDNRP